MDSDRTGQKTGIQIRFRGDPKNCKGIKPTPFTCFVCRDYFFSVIKICQPVAGQSLVLNSGVVDHRQGATQLIVEEPQGVVLNRKQVKGTGPQGLLKRVINKSKIF